MYSLNKNIFILCCTIILSIIGMSCAGQQAPSGGPVDSIPPTITSSYPEPGTLHFDDNVIRLEFSEYVDKRSVDESIFISPDVGYLEVGWVGTEVEIKFSDSLRKNTTYVVTIGTDVKDIHNANKMSKAYSLAFSTGDHIDSGTVIGKVFDANPAGVMIFAFALNDRRPDTLNPRYTKPDYLTQTGTDGSFTLPFLSIGDYRLFAIRDAYKNLLYDAQVDQFGATVSDLSIKPDNNIIQGIQFRLTAEDTSAPFLSSCRAVDKRHLRVLFSEPMDTATIESGSFIIKDTVTQQLLTVIDVALFDTSKSEVTILTAEQESTKTYRLFVVHGTDYGGNKISDSTNSALFDGSNTNDTTKPAVRFANISDGAKDVFPGDPIDLSLSEWVIRQKFAASFSLKDSAKNSIPGVLKWWNSTHVSYIHSSQLQFGMVYEITLLLDSIIDIEGNRFTDSVRTVRFQVSSKDNLGSIAGAVEDEREGNIEGKIYIEAIPLQEQGRSFKQILKALGSYFFDNMPEGKYVISGFIDADSNTAYSYGNLYPYKPSERFTYFRDTLKVRARWSQEGAKLIFK